MSLPTAPVCLTRGVCPLDDVADIFAVRQWPGNGADLDFRPVVRDANAFLLVAQYPDLHSSMSLLNPKTLTNMKVPEALLKGCAFFRLW